MLRLDNGTDQLDLLCTMTRPAGCASRERSVPEAGRLSVDPDQKICDGVAASVGDEDEPLSMHRLIGCQGSLFVTANPCIPRGGEEKAEVVQAAAGSKWQSDQNMSISARVNVPTRRSSCLCCQRFSAMPIPSSIAKGTLVLRLQRESWLLRWPIRPRPVCAASQAMLVGGTW